MSQHFAREMQLRRMLHTVPSAGAPQPAGRSWWAALWGRLGIARSHGQVASDETSDRFTRTV